MNIFQVLSQGQSRLHEPSMSAMLGYLLDSNKDHGLGDAFVRVFLQRIDGHLFENILSQAFINASVELESQYDLNGSKKYIDIEISLLDKKRKEVTHTIIIENKIRVGAANEKQLGDYYNAKLQEESIKNLLIVFLTPKSNSAQLHAEFNNLKVNESLNHRKKWMYWDSSDVDNDGILTMVREILSQEAQGKINPINEYMRHTLKAFVQHSGNTVQSKGLKTMRRGEDIGEIIEEASIKLKDGSSYLVVLRDSTQVQVFNSETEDKEVARYILAKFIDENKLRIPHSELNTRSIGKQFFKWYANSAA